MVQSNRTAVEQNKIDPDERLDLVVPRNGSRRIRVELAAEDDEGNLQPIDLTGQTIIAQAKTSYQAATIAINGTISDRDDTAGVFYLTYDAASAEGLGIDVPDLVHDALRAPSGGGEDPVRIFAGLLDLSKGVAKIP